MKVFKYDKRSVKTRDRIKKAVSILLKNNANGNIKITDITNTAKISRNSFYTHYSNINDVLEDIFLDVVSSYDKIFEKFDYFEFVSNPYNFLKELTIGLTKYQAFTEYVFFSKSSNSLVQYLIDSLTDKFLQIYKSVRGVAIEIVPYFIQFLVSGCVEMLYKYYKEGKTANFDNILDNISKFIASGIVVFRDIKNNN